MLEQLFGSKTRIKILNLLFQHPQRSFFMRELARLLETQLNAVRRELINLVEAGLVVEVDMASEKELNVRHSGDLGTARSKYYRLNTGSLLFFELKALLLKEQMLRERELVDSLKNKAGDIKVLILTGVFADVSSETDILLVGDIKPTVVAKLIGEFEKKLGKILKYTIMTQNEFNERKEIGDKFLYGVLEGKHVSVIDRLTV